MITMALKLMIQNMDQKTISEMNWISIVVVAGIDNSNALQCMEPQSADSRGNSQKASGLAGSSQVSQLTSNS